MLIFSPLPGGWAVLLHITFRLRPPSGLRSFLTLLSSTQANVIPIRWDRIEMQYLEELSIGTWHLKMSTQ